MGNKHGQGKSIEKQQDNKFYVYLGNWVRGEKSGNGIVMHFTTTSNSVMLPSDSYGTAVSW